MDSKTLIEAYEQARKSSPAAASEARYREQWRWDKTARGTHCVDCYPGNCPMHVYIRDGKVVREEQAGDIGVIEPGVPDANPMGCQKGACWSQTLDGEDRISQPLRRAGERGEGRWQEISWDEALTEIADSMLDAMQDKGADSILGVQGAEAATWGLVGTGRLLNMLGSIVTDVNAEINDFSPGIYLTLGKFNVCSSLDDWFHAELTLMFQCNPTYTVNASQHFMLESRYNGGEFVLFAPDCSPSSQFADYHLPVRPGTDAAWALAMCKVIIDEGIYDSLFVKDQTDLPLLVRLDTRHYLRAEDLEEGGSPEQFYFFDERTRRVAEARRDTLALGDLSPALEGRYEVTLRGGERVEVTPVFELLREHLESFTPEQAHEICGVHPDAIRSIARKVATKRTYVMAGGTSFKYYHGDLMVRASMLLLALTGNWGRKGSGNGAWSTGMFDGLMILARKTESGVEHTQTILDLQAAVQAAIREEDPTRSDEMVRIEMAARMGSAAGLVPPAFLWYRHCGYQENWNRAGWSDPSMKRPFDEYMQEAIEKGWWSGVDRPAEDTPPRVLFNWGGNMLRRMRGGQNILLEHLWPKLDKIVTLDWRMSTTGMFSDLILPVTNQYEAPNFAIPSPHTLVLNYCDRAVEPPGQAKSEWEIGVLLSRKLAERAKARGFESYVDRMGMTQRMEELPDKFTLGGEVVTEEQACEEMLRDTAYIGTVPEGTDLAKMREQGHVRFIDWGITPFGVNMASDLKPDETMNHCRWHREKKVPYPTLTRRAQFYIDHPWFMEAGEVLPTHKENPRMGGDHPFEMTSGHNRWSIHSINITNRLLLNTHRGRPHALVNTDDARERSIEDGDEMRVWNDMGEFFVPAKVAPNVRRGQVIVYNGWEPYMFRGWRGPMDVEPGMVKWLHLAGGYGHLRYWPLQWQPVPIDRAIRIDIEKAT
ncbi:MAG: molybdopterin-dependent oxidoreductase [Deltaproteobacteria bacterium]|nr:molybdopterin-dependent oxidoreductase [Deltaproteobacteria bacterium]